MQEDLKISIGANTRKAEEDIKKLGKIVPEFTAEIALKFKKKNELQNEIKNIQNELDKVALNPKAFDKEQVKQWRAQIKEAKKEIKELKVGTGGNFFKEAYEEAKRLSSRVKEIKLDPKSFSTEDIKILRSEIEATALKAKALNFAEGTGKSQNLVNQLKNSSLELDKINNQSGHTKKAFGMMDIAVGNLAATLAVKVLGALKEITLEGIKFNQQMEFATEKTRTISASGGASINSNTWRIAKDTGVNPLELKEGLYQVVSAIGDTHKKYALLETANKLATVGFSTTTESVNGLTTVLNAYNLEIEDADRIANIFVRTQKVGKLTVQEFNRELYKTVPVAKELRIGIDEVGASIALLTAKGSKAEIAQTQMGAFMYELLDVGSDVSKLFTQISGQSLDSYMSSGGNFEGILRQLKDYSNANNFKIESLFGRKEAKSFWLNIGNDIDGYINKLNAINDPINELQRNFENLLNTEEKRLARANNYWLQFKQTIGSVAGEVLASIGDLVTGADTETAARQRLNNELDNSIKTLEELSKKQTLSKEEQVTFNKAIENLTILAPGVAEAYKEWTLNGGDYAEVLKEIHKAQKKVNEEASIITLKSKEQEIKSTRKQLADVEAKLGRGRFDTGEFNRYQKEEYEKNGEYPAKTFDEWLREIKLPKIQNSANNKEKIEDLGYFQLRESLVKQLEKQVTDQKNIEDKLLNPNSEKLQSLKEDKTIETTSQIEGNYTNWDAKNKELERTKQRAIIEAKKEYAVQLKTTTDETRPKIDEAYQGKLAKIEDDSRIAGLEIKIEELKSRILNERDKSIVEKTNNEINSLILEKDDVQANVIIRDETNRKNQEKLRREEEEKQYQLKEQGIKNRFSSEKIEVEKQYQEQLKELNSNYSAHKYKKLKEEREKELALINTNEKIALLEAQRNKLNPKKDWLKIDDLNNEIITTQLNFNNSSIDKEINDRVENLKDSISDITRNLSNLSRIFEATGNKTASNMMKGASAIFDTVGNMSTDSLDKISNSLGFGNKFKETSLGKGLESFGAGMGIGSGIDAAISGGSKEGQIGSTAGAAIGAGLGSVVPGLGTAAGAIVGGTIGGATGGLFGNKKKKKAKREKKRAEEAQKRLQEGQISGQFKFQDTIEAFNEELEKSGLGTKVNMLDQVSKNTNYDDIKSSLTGAQVGKDGMSISQLKKLMPHMEEQEIVDWFKATTGGAVVNGDTISTGEGKYGSIDIGALAQQITQANRELEASLKETIKNIIDFSADKISGVVRDGFGDGIDDLGDNLEKAVADSLKNAFLQTEIAKGLFNGLSDKVTNMITDMFKNDKNLGIDLDISNLENLSLDEYINLIKQYMELGNEELKNIFESLGISLDNLNNTVDKANKNSKNTVQGMATNLWLQNLGNYQSDLNGLVNTLNTMNLRTDNLMKSEKNAISIPQLKENSLEKTLKNIMIEMPELKVDNVISLEIGGKAFDLKINEVVQKAKRIDNQQMKATVRYR
ncbi:MAG: phage tail tape measure protein [Cetobacterium sp.]|uniref:phage tail tape measure protein n=1 Tax=Cetobacterium sp. TaxID=2071632 RepID=UPI002FCAE84C